MAGGETEILQVRGLEWVFYSFVCRMKRWKKYHAREYSLLICKWQREKKILKLCNVLISVCCCLQLHFVSKQVARSRTRHLLQDWAPPPSPRLDPCSLRSQTPPSRQVCPQADPPRTPFMCYLQVPSFYILVWMHRLLIFLKLDSCVFCVVLIFSGECSECLRHFLVFILASFQ